MRRTTTSTTTMDTNYDMLRLLLLLACSRSTQILLAGQFRALLQHFCIRILYDLQGRCGVVVSDKAFSGIGPTSWAPRCF